MCTRTSSTLAGTKPHAFAASAAAQAPVPQAIVTPAPLAPYLSKFAVGTVSRGEGVGRVARAEVMGDHALAHQPDEARREDPRAHEDPAARGGH